MLSGKCEWDYGLSLFSAPLHLLSLLHFRVEGLGIVPDASRHFFVTLSARHIFFLKTKEIKGTGILKLNSLLGVHEHVTFACTESDHWLI